MGLNLRILDGELGSAELNIVLMKDNGSNRHLESESEEPVSEVELNDTFILVNSGQSATIEIVDRYALESDPKIVGKSIIPNFTLVGEEVGGHIVVCRSGRKQEYVIENESIVLADGPNELKELLGIPIIDDDWEKDPSFSAQKRIYANLGIEFDPYIFYAENFINLDEFRRIRIDGF
jgi:hypothetical protein